MRVLHVEDNPTDADLAHRMLVRRAPEIVLERCSTRVDAMARLQPAERFDLAIIDLHLPDGSGLELLTWIRERRLPVAVVVMTGTGDQEAAIAALKAGADDYITKGTDAFDRLPITLQDARRRFREAHARRARTLRVLYAEHNRAHIDLTRRYFARHAPYIRLTVFSDVDQVLARLPPDPDTSCDYDLVLLDYRLPGVDALEAVKALRVERGLDIPIVMVTGHGSEEVAASAIHLGVSDYVSKHAGYLHELPATLEKAWSQAELARQSANLRAISDQLNLALATSPVILYRRRLDTANKDLTWISENIVGLLGDSVATALRPGWWLARLYPEDRAGALSWLAHRGGAKCWSHIYRFLDGQGRVRWIQDEIQPPDAAAGTAREATGAWRDITETRLAEQMREIRMVLLDALLAEHSLADILRKITSQVERILPDMRVTIVCEQDDHQAAAQPVPLGCGPDWDLPLMDGQGQTLGHLLAHYRNPRPPTPQEQQLLEEVASIAGIAVAHVRANTRLRQAAAVFESTREGVLVTDLTGRILTVNRAFTDITGYSEGEVLGRNPRLLRSSRQAPAFYQAMWASIETNGHWQGEIWNRRKSGDIYPEILNISTVYDGQGQPSHYVGVITDISQLKESQAQLERLVHYDPLTDLPNRRLVESRLQHALAKAGRQDHLVAVLFIDLDRFKDVNDSLGHPIGDELLQALAKRLTSRLRAEDTLARLGGDEFLVLVEDLVRPGDAATVAQTMLRELERPFSLPSGAEIYAGASIGISLYPNDGRSVTDLIKHADVAMYKAKNEGRSTYRFYTPGLTSAANERLALEARLRRALLNDELVLHYQPQIESDTGRLIGCEALVRWHCPEEGLILPGRFIPLAEETGLIVPLGEWVLSTACAQGRRWLGAGLSDLVMTVNLSGRQLRRPDLVPTIAEILKQTQLPPDRLKLELTESTIMGQGDQAVELLQALKSLGVRLSIDDFGTGYSSLAHLKRFPIDELKVDRSFVKDIPEDTNDMEIAATIIAMARNLKLRVIAEGVETQSQLEFLTSHGCHACQGFLFGRPVPEDAFLLLVGHQGSE